MIKIRIGKKMKGTAVVILDDNDNILLLLRSKKSSWMPAKWGLPGGKIETGENSAGAVIRETKEETDLDIEISNLKHLENFSSRGIDMFYVSSYDGSVKIDFEHDDHKWVPRQEMERYSTTPGLVEIFDWVLENER
jgi:8-oxo-dGTP diphosphatase